MKLPNLYYPVALIVIILFAGYLMYGGLLKPPQVDLAKYQELCTQYVTAPAGQHTRTEMQMLVNEINYLLPAPINELTVSAERELKSCAGKLAAQVAASQQ